MKLKNDIQNFLLYLKAEYYKFIDKPYMVPEY